MAAGTWPCRADSGLSPGPHTAFGTGAKNNSWSAMLGCFFSAALSAPPIDDRATHDSAIASVTACLTYLFRLLIRSILLDLRKVRCLSAVCNATGHAILLRRPSGAQASTQKLVRCMRRSLANAGPTQKPSAALARYLTRAIGDCAVHEHAVDTDS